MPRTKVSTKKNYKKFEEEEGIDRQLLLNHLCDIHNDLVDQYKIGIHMAIEDNCTQLLNQSTTMLNKKISNLLNMDSLSANSIPSVNVTCKQDILNRTKTIKKDTKKGKRSSSLVDEGYLTTESSNSVGRISSRQSRARVDQNIIEKPSRISRSLSRNKQPKNNFLTPADKKISPNNYGMITPKCKPNTPQVILRRPKAGEVALSFQGSPLLTAPVATDYMANVNIPLTDGTLLSLRAQEGLRLSQIPQFDSVTLRQLGTLSKNISMVLKSVKNLD